MVARREAAGADYVPDRGDIVWLSFTPHAGHEQAGRRPALVVNPRSYNEKSSLALLCPITSIVESYPFEVALPSDGPVTGVVLADQVRSLDWRARSARTAAKVPPRVVGEALDKLAVLLEQG